MKNDMSDYLRNEGFKTVEMDPSLALYFNEPSFKIVE